MAESVSLSEENLVASICRESFYEFVKEYWSCVIAEKPIWNWHIKYLCSQMQIVAERVFKGEESPYDVIINIPPGTTKSTVVSVMFPAWVWTRMPSARLICASYAHLLALDLSRKCRDLVRDERYQRAFPMALSDDQDTKGYFANQKGGCRLAVAAGGALGFHGHFILIDDPIDPEEALSPTVMESTNAWITGTLASRKVDKKVTPTVLVMQRLHQNDPSAYLLEKAKDPDSGVTVRHICLPAELSDRVKPAKLRARYVDGLLDPVRLDRKVLKKMRALLGNYLYSAQFDQWPIPLEGGMFKTDMIQVLDAPGPSRFKRLVRGWDKAGTKMPTATKKSGGPAWSVGVLLGQDLDDFWWILDCQRGRWSSDERERNIVSTAATDGMRVEIAIEQEPGSGGKESAENTVRRLPGYVVTVVRPSGDKALRADPFSVQVNSGNVRAKKDAPWWANYKEEMAYFPNSTFMDQVDATSLAFTVANEGVVHVGAWGGSDLKVAIGEGDDDDFEDDN